MLNQLARQIISKRTVAIRSFSAKAVKSNVSGLSRKCVDVPKSPVGPGASKDKEYKNPEYFCYHTNSFAEAEVEMAKYRLPAPSNKKPFTQ